VFFGQLASLTLLINKSQYMSIEDLYPQHYKPLENVGLPLAQVPMLQEVLNLNEGKYKCKEEKMEQDKQINISVYFCIGYSKFWKEPIHKWLKKLRNRFNLNILPPIPQSEGDACRRSLQKAHQRVKSMDFKVQDCNCRDPTRGTGKRQYGGIYRVLIVIHKITCKMTNKIYIGNMQQNFKK
jgi:hypothetical protein